MSAVPVCLQMSAVPVCLPNVCRTCMSVYHKTECWSTRCLYHTHVCSRTEGSQCRSAYSGRWAGHPVQPATFYFCLTSKNEKVYTTNYIVLSRVKISATELDSERVEKSAAEFSSINFTKIGTQGANTVQ
jgi:hypothetical protein